MPVKNRLADLSTEVAMWRRDMHRHPELLFDTVRTAGLVEDKLRAFGCDEVVTGIGRCGVVGIIKGRQAKSGQVIGLRADMDALPIKEETGLDHASQRDGKMHACGHDGHTAMLLGAAQYLAETRHFDGHVAVIFQPAEEGGGGGREMVEDGLIERFGISEMYGMHNLPGLDVGRFAIRKGPFFAAADSFEIIVNGKGGHAAFPHESIDPVLVGAHIVTAVQSLVSRNLDPVHQAVISITAFRTESDAFNVIAPRAVMKGTMRTLDRDDRRCLTLRLEEIVTNTAAAFGASADFEFRPGYPVMVNSAAHTDYAAAAADRVSGQVNADAAINMGAEDFSYMLEACPGAYIFTGNGSSAPLHHPAYDFNDDAIPFGCSWWVEMAESRLPID